MAVNAVRRRPRRFSPRETFELSYCQNEDQCRRTIENSKGEIFTNLYNWKDQCFILLIKTNPRYDWDLIHGIFFNRNKSNPAKGTLKLGMSNFPENFYPGFYFFCQVMDKNQRENRDGLIVCEKLKQCRTKLDN